MAGVNPPTLLAPFLGQGFLQGVTSAAFLFEKDLCRWPRGASQGGEENDQYCKHECLAHGEVSFPLRLRQFDEIGGPNTGFLNESRTLNPSAQNMVHALIM